MKWTVMKDGQKVVIGAAIYRSNNKGETWQKQSEIHDFFRLSEHKAWYSDR